MTHYQTLGLTPQATPEAIKSAHRKLVRLHHPDKGGDPVLFKAIQAAADALSDPEKRRQYDESMRNQPVESLTETAAEIVGEYFAQC